MPVENMRMIHFRTVARWVRILRVEEEDYLPECLPMRFLNRLEELLNGSHPFPNLRYLVLQHNHHSDSCLQSYHLARFLIQPKLESLDMSTKAEHGGFLLAPTDIEALSTDLHGKLIALKRLGVRSAYPTNVSVTLSQVVSAVTAIGSISTLTHLSINGSLLCGSALLKLGSLDMLGVFEIEGGILSGMVMTMPGEGYFPALKVLALRFLPAEDSRILCSCTSLLNSLRILSVEWDSQTEFGDPEIDRTLWEVGRQCRSLIELRVGLFEKFRPRKAHGVPYSIWHDLASRSLRTLALLGLFLRAEKLERLLPDITETWPNLVSLIIPAHALNLEQKTSPSCSPSSSLMIVHSGHVISFDNPMFVVWWVFKC
jgi:hypothetical protein